MCVFVISFIVSSLDGDKRLFLQVSSVKTLILKETETIETSMLFLTRKYIFLETTAFKMHLTNAMIGAIVRNHPYR